MSFKNVITVDFETYYDTQYSLTKMPTAQYVYDPMFEAIGCGVKLNQGETVWVTQPNLEYVLSKHMPWKDSLVVAHNAMFDGLILEYYYNAKPAHYFCTMMGSRPFFSSTRPGAWGLTP